MKNFIAISVVSGGGRELQDLTETINKILCTPLKTDVFVYDASEQGIHRTTRNILKSYNRYGVFYKRIKRGADLVTVDKNNERQNLAIAQALLDFNNIRSNKYATFLHLNQNMIFSGFDLQILVENAQLYNALSPVIESLDGIEILSALFDRWGAEYFPLDELTTHHITGAIEETYALNPKCFALSRRFAKKLCNFTYSDRDPVHYLNQLVYDNADKYPKVDTQIFVHENLY